MSWDFYIKQFQNYMKLERSLAENSIDAYLHDVVKLKQFIEISNINISPIEITGKHLQDFLEYINDLGMTAYSQARILSGLKAFYKDILEQKKHSETICTANDFKFLILSYFLNIKIKKLQYELAQEIGHPNNVGGKIFNIYKNEFNNKK